MTAQAGKDLLLKVEDKALVGTFINVGGFKSNGITINGEYVDTTSKDSGGWKEVLDGAGMSSVSLSGSGVFMSDAAFAQVNDDMLTRKLRLWQCIVPGLGTYEGTFSLSSLEVSGEHSGEVSYTLSLESASAVTFTAAV